MATNLKLNHIEVLSSLYLSMKLLKALKFHLSKAFSVPYKIFNEEVSFSLSSR